MTPLRYARAGVGRARAGVRWVRLAFRNRALRAGAAYGVAYVAAIASIVSFLWRGGGYPSRLEFSLLVVTLTLYLVLAVGSSGFGGGR